MSVDTLLNFNGTNGTQVFTDDGLSPVVWTPSGATPVLDTTVKKFGSSSLRFDGASDISSTLTLSDTFTIECWVDFDSFTTGVYQNIFEFESVGNITLVGVNVYGDLLGFYDSLVSRTSSNFVLQTGVFNHVALTVEKDICRLYLNGLFAVKIQYADYNLLNEIYLGRSGHNTSPLTGYIDGFRVTDGEILYNILSRTTDVPTAELTTTTVPAPTLPTDHDVRYLNNLSDITTNIFLGLDGENIIIGGGSSGTTVTPDPTSTNIISGNIKKFGLPFGARVAVVSTGLPPEVVGSGTSDEITGDYSIDVYPYADECLIYVAPEYGNAFQANTFVGVGQIVHPTVPNRYIYICTVAGNTGSSEPTWGTQGSINSGAATFDTLPLYRPLMNGFVKPVVTPI